MSPSPTPCSLRKTALLIAFFVVIGFDCFGQAARPNRGTMPTGSYAVSDIENINLSNGNLNVSIPLASLPPIAGGKLELTVRAEYNSKGWDAVREELQSDPTDPTTRYVVTQLQQSSSSGWRIGAGYSISFENVSWEHIAIPPSQNDPEYNLITQNRWSKVMLHTPDGATHELRPMDYLAYQDGFLLRNYLRGYYKDDPNTANTALRYYSFDGSHLWAKIDPSPNLHFGPAPSWTIYLPDGTRVEQANGVQRIIDTNGNKIKIWGECSGLVCTSHYEDEQTNREIKIVYDAAGNGGHGLAQVIYQTVGGVWMTTTVNFGSTRVFGKVYSINDPDCADPSVYVDTTIPVMRSIVFPQTEPGQPPRQMTFSYNSDTTVTSNVSWRPSCGSPYQTITSSSNGWGSLSSITQVSGATINYQSSLGAHQLFNPDDAPRENILSKTVTHDGIDEVWTYDVSPTGSSMTSPDGSFVEESRYPSDPAFAHTYAGFGGKEGLVYRTNQSNKILIERHWTLMIFAGGENLAPGSNVLVGFNPVVDAEYTTLLDDTPAHNPVKMSAKTFQYDYNGNLLKQKEYDWFDPSLVSRDAQGVPTAVPAGATLLKETNSTYYNEATTFTSANVYAKRAVATAAPLILNAARETILGTSKVRFRYDGQAFNVAPTVGNLTTKEVWVDLDSRWITTSNTYGLYGNIASAIDARGNVTQYFYDDATHALPNRVVVDPQNGTGTQTTTTAYDYHTGLVTSQTDSNNQVSTIDYTNQLLGTVDPFGRPGVTKSPQVNINGTNHRHRVTTTYLDSARR